jgi:hypothetical protein
MKVKLLKKVRKRFVIEHFPNGFVSKNRGPYNFNLFRLTDTKNDKYGFNIRWVGLNPLLSQYATCCTNIGGIVGSVQTFKTSKECIDYLKQDIIQILRNEGYRGRKDKPDYRPVNKVWYNG